MRVQPRSLNLSLSLSLSFSLSLSLSLSFFLLHMSFLGSLPAKGPSSSTCLSKPHLLEDKNTLSGITHICMDLISVRKGTKDSWVSEKAYSFGQE
jgi:hypothetical protein